MADDSKPGWQDPVGVVGVALTVLGMSDGPLMLRLLCFAGGAICFPVSFLSQPLWPRWVRWVFTITALILISWLSWSIKKAVANR